MELEAINIISSGISQGFFLKNSHIKHIILTCCTHFSYVNHTKSLQVVSRLTQLIIWSGRLHLHSLGFKEASKPKTKREIFFEKQM